MRLRYYYLVIADVSREGEVIPSLDIIHLHSDISVGTLTFSAFISCAESKDS